MIVMLIFVYKWTMDAVDLILLGVIIGSNNLAVSFALGALKTKKYHLRIVVIFGIFEFFIPLLGLIIGTFFKDFIDDYATLIGTIILIALGAFTIGNAFIKKSDTQALTQKIASYKGLISLAFGLSLDDLMVGFSLGLRDVNPFLLAGVIASFSSLFAFTGLKVGKFLDQKSQLFTKVGAGALLIMLGIATYLGWLG